MPLRTNRRPDLRKNVALAFPAREERNFSVALVRVADAVSPVTAGGIAPTGLTYT